MFKEYGDTGLIVTQERYALDPLARVLFGGPANRAGLALHDMIRNRLSYGAIPHLGAEYMAAYLAQAGYKPKVVPLFGKGTESLIKNSAVTLISAMDIGVDRVAELLQNVGKEYHNRIIIGGHGLQQQASYGETTLNETARHLLDRFPRIALCPTEGEEVIGQALSDLKTQGEMQQVYARKDRFDMKQKDQEPYFQSLTGNGQTLWRKSLLKVVEAGRGCYEDCFFCPTAKLAVRNTPIELLKMEITALKVKPWKVLFFVDQNLAAYPSRYLHELFDFINYHNTKWIGQGTVSYKLHDEALLRKIAKNCLTFLIGVEDPLHPTDGSKTKTRFSHDGELAGLVKYLRFLKLPIVYSMVIGTDFQEPGDGEKLARMALDLGITPAMHIATPRIGTRFWDQLVAERRLQTKESVKRNMRFDAVHDAAKLTREEILREFSVFQELVYTPEAITTRFLRNLVEAGLQYASGLLPTELAYMASAVVFRQMHPEAVREAQRRISITRYPAVSVAD